MIASVLPQAAPLGEGGPGVDLVLGPDARSGRQGPAGPAELPGGGLGGAEEEGAAATHEGGAGEQVSVWWEAWSQANLQPSLMTGLVHFDLQCGKAFLTDLC